MFVFRFFRIFNLSIEWFQYLKMYLKFFSKGSIRCPKFMVPFVVSKMILEWMKMYRITYLVLWFWKIFYQIRIKSIILNWNCIVIKLKLNYCFYQSSLKHHKVNKTLQWLEKFYNHQRNKIFKARSKR